jgi:hypothetical protein
LRHQSGSLDLSMKNGGTPHRESLELHGISIKQVCPCGGGVFIHV